MERLTKAMKTSRAPAAVKLTRPFLRFTKIQGSSSIILLICTAAALIWANTLTNVYVGLWQTKLVIGLGNSVLAKSLLLWISDGLMAIFFFFIGLEIKRELLVGEMSTARKAILPIFAALGGMVFPAVLFIILNLGTEGARGFGIPMATDIAFALGVLTLMGKRIPSALKVFLAALAIIDDIGAILVIALFYTAEISWINFAIGGGFLIGAIAANWADIRSPLIYAILGIGLWVAFLMSGLHATVAGVLLAFTVPATVRIDPDEFLELSKTCIDEFENASYNMTTVFTTAKQHEALKKLETASQHAETPLHRMEYALHYWVAFAIMPLFALANAGVNLGGDLTSALIHPVTLGIVIGLVVGKQVGITLFSWIAVRSGLATLPSGVSWHQIYGVSCLAGIGFTMSLFIAGLAFEGMALLSTAKVGILMASLIAGVVGWIVLQKEYPTSAEIATVK